MAFKIDKKFLNSSFFISELKLCTLRLNDNSNFPWVILIPKRKNLSDISDLKLRDQIMLIKEIVLISKIMKKIFKTSSINVEKIGNIVNQLHVHIIARKKSDISWPQSVWVVKGKNYKKNLAKKLIKKIFFALNKKR
ncbi:HIT domain-containing protein [Candidatus Pelagibacter sp. FZCC0015]|uniref:HIT domain-containing protein n=1 Tax=Candidatus Pelagibacter sp. FZCC0015 TaxID=2268451 RepID=UPI00119F5872|nr:HIT domain-containing protein [Candidatus Pelagibacter sp. FZCC0015]